MECIVNRGKGFRPSVWLAGRSSWPESGAKAAGFCTLAGRTRIRHGFAFPTFLGHSHMGVSQAANRTSDRDRLLSTIDRDRV